MTTHKADKMIDPTVLAGDEICIKGRGRKINLASGDKVEKGFLNIDRAGKPNVLGDVRWLPLLSGSFGQARALHILEHIPREQLVSTMNEWWRVLKVGGILDIEVPITPSEDAFADPTHVSFFVPKTFAYFTRDHGHEEHRVLYDIKPWKMLHRSRMGANSILRVILKKVPA